MVVVGEWLAFVVVVGSCCGDNGVGVALMVCYWLHRSVRSSSDVVGRVVTMAEDVPLVAWWW